MKILYIVGPTASGKTDLAIKAAKILNGEIVAADSRTIYKSMDIGTAKPSVAEQAGIKHYCLDIINPNEEFTVADYVDCAESAISNIKEQGKLPIVVGGSGLYIDALLYGFTFTPPNKELRKKYSSYTIEKLQTEIKSLGLVMPENLKNKRYLQATLERQDNQPKSKTIKKGTVIIGLDPGKDVLEKRMNKRALAMLHSGIKNEASELFGKYDPDLNAFNGGIYKLMPQYLNNELDDKELVEQCVKTDVKLAKKQRTWFKRNRYIKWFNDANTAYDWLVKQTSDTIN